MTDITPGPGNGSQARGWQLPKEVVVAIIGVCGTVVVALITNSFNAYLDHERQMVVLAQKKQDDVNQQRSLALTSIMKGPQDRHSLDAIAILSQVGALEDPDGRIGRAATILINHLPAAAPPGETKDVNAPSPVKTSSAAPVSTYVSQDKSDGVPSPVSFAWPVRGTAILKFGRDAAGISDGINISAANQAPIRAAAAGTVSYAGELTGYGNLLLIKHSNGFVTAYAHASRFLPARGDLVLKGQIIGYVGQTGDVTSPQLLFEIRNGTVPVDPLKYLEKLE